MNAKETPALFSNSLALLSGAPIRRPPSLLETKSHCRLKCQGLITETPATEAPKWKWRLGVRPAQQLLLLFSIISKPYSAYMMTHVHGFGVRRSCLVNEKTSGRMESGSGGTNLGTLISISILRSLSYLTPWQLFTSSSKGRDVHFNLLLSVRSSGLSTVLGSIQLFATP